MNIYINHNIVSKEIFDTLNIQQAFPEFNITINYGEKTMILTINTHYMCQGNGLSIESINIDEHDFEEDDINNLDFNKILQQNIKDTIFREYHIEEIADYIINELN
jgi:hypothetical protein